MNKLSWYELVPLFSFLGLRGRCKNCKTKISVQYPLVEFLSGLIFAVIFLKFQDFFLFTQFKLFAISYIYYAFIFSVLLIIAVYDIRHKIIPDKLSLVFGVLAFIGLFIFRDYAFSPHLPTILELLSGIFISAPFAFLWFISDGKWMGFGDAKLALGIGWLLGTFLAFFALIISFWTGAILGILLIILKKSKYGMKTELPFAPYLVFGTFLVFVFGLSICPFFYPFI